VLKQCGLRKKAGALVEIVEHGERTGGSDAPSDFSSSRMGRALAASSARANDQTATHRGGKADDPKIDFGDISRVRTNE
jgi:hypothetical protein